MLGKQAKILTSRQESLVLKHLETTRHPARDRVMFLLSVKAGLRAKEIASVSWSMVTDAHGRVADEIALEDRASKGRGGRRVPMHKTTMRQTGAAHFTENRRGGCTNRHWKSAARVALPR